MKLSDIQKVHFVGIGGIGMSGLARLFLSEGKEVSGSDRVPSEITKALESEGIQFFPHQNGSSLSKNIDLVVYTEAIAKDHVEIRRAEELGLTMMSYFEALGMVANEYYLIAVAGTHGKTTTTAILIDIFEEAGLDPSAIVGSLRSKTKSNYRKGKSKYFIVEACEYRRDFLSLRPDVLVITNIEHDHVDYYPTLRDVQEAFRTFAAQVREGGLVVMNFGGDNMASILEGLTVPIVDYGKYVNPLRKLSIPGIHNQMNAAAAVAVAEYVGISRDIIEHALENFASTWRRFEYKGEVQGAKVYDDYAHHPTAIKATLSGVRELYPDKKIILVYQPHLDSRTEGLFNDFVDAFDEVDSLILYPAYVARADAGSHDTTQRLAEAVRAHDNKVKYIETFEGVIDEVKKIASKEHVVMVMGAGDITEVAERLTK